MNLGALVVEMNAQSKALAKGLREGLQQVDAAVQQMKKLSREVASAGMAITAFFGGMVRAAASVDYGMKKSLDRLKDSFLTLAVQVAHMVQPALQQLTALLRDLANWFAGLPASTRQSISDFALFAVKAGALGMAFSKIVGFVQATIAVMSGLAAVVAAIGAGPIAILVAGLTAVLIVIAVLHKAWRLNWGGIQDVTRNVIGTISGWWGKFASFLGDIWSGIVDDMASKAKLIIALVLKVMTMTGKLDEKSAGMMQGAANLAINSVAASAKSPMAMGSIALEAGKILKGGALDLKKELALIGKELRDALGLTSTGKGAAGVSSSKNGRGGAPEAYSDAVENAIKHSLDKPQRVSQTSAARSAGVDGASQEFWKGMEEMGPMMARLIGPLKQFASELGTALIESVSNVSGALGFAGNMLASKMGELGQVINSVVQGAQQGGVWGALAAFIIELMSRMKGFQQILDVGMGQLNTALADLNGPLTTLIGAFKQLMGGVGVLTKALHPIIGFVVNVISRVLKTLTPIFVLIGTILEPIGMIFDALSHFMDALDMLIPVFDIIGAVMSIVAISVMGIMIGIGEVWNWVVKLVADILRKLGQGGAAAEVEKGVMDTAGMKQKINDMANNIFKGGLNKIADESAAAAEGLGQVANASQEATEQLLNVPQGYKVAFDRLMSTAATSSSGGFGSIGMSTEERRQLFLNTGNPSRKRLHGKG